CRYGYRCTVTAVEAPQHTTLLPHWLLDLESAVAQLAVRFVTALVEGDAFSAKELRCMQWLDSPLLRGGPEAADSTPFLTALARGGAEAGPLFSWMKSATRGVRAQATAETQAWLDEAERAVVAAMLKHCGLVAEAQAFAKLLAAAGASASSN